MPVFAGLKLQWPFELKTPFASMSLVKFVNSHQTEHLRKLSMMATPHTLLKMAMTANWTCSTSIGHRQLVLIVIWIAASDSVHFEYDGCPRSLGCLTSPAVPIKKLQVAIMAMHQASAIWICAMCP